MAIRIQYFSEATLCHLRPQQGLSERHQRRALDVTLACKLTHAYGKYHLAMASQGVVYERREGFLSAGGTDGSNDESVDYHSFLTVGLLANKGGKRE